MAVSETKSVDLLVSSYTIAGGHQYGEGKGLTKLNLNLETSEFAILQEFKTLNAWGDNGCPSYLVKGKNRLYAANEHLNGTCVACDLQTFQKISESPVVGEAPCHITLSHDENYLFCAIYVSGELVAMELNPDGDFTGQFYKALPPFGATAKYGKYPTRQDKNHAHFVLTHPTENNLVFLADLGSDNVVCYSLQKNLETAGGEMELIFQCNCQLPYGTGPRTMSWDKDGEKIYVSGELNNMVSVILFKEGKLEHISSAYGFKEEGLISCMSHIDTSLCGQFVLVANRDHVAPVGGKPDRDEFAGKAGSISLFRVSDEGLELVSVCSCGGLTPRHFVQINHEIVVVCCQDGNLITLMRLHGGKLTLLEPRIQVNTPNCAIEL